MLRQSSLLARLETVMTLAASSINSGRAHLLLLLLLLLMVVDITRHHFIASPRTCARTFTLRDITRLRRLLISQRWRQCALLSVPLVVQACAVTGRHYRSNRPTSPSCVSRSNSTAARPDPRAVPLSSRRHRRRRKFSLIDVFIVIGDENSL